MIALFIIFIFFALHLLFIAVFVIVNSLFSRLILIIIIRLETTCSFMLARLPLCFAVSKSILGLTHFVLCKHLVFFSFIIKDFLFFSFFLLTFKFINNISLLSPSFYILKVVHIKLVFQIVNVCKLFNIDAIKSFKFTFKSFIFFLIFWFYVFYTFETFFGSF